jgi:hypothetical protein
VEGLHLTMRVIRPEVDAAHGRVDLEWTLANTSPEPFVILRHLFNGFGPQGRLRVDPNMVYRSVRADGSVDLSKRIVVPPPSALVRLELMASVPLGEELMAGGQMSETFSLSSPVVPWNPRGESVDEPAGAKSLVRVRSSVLRFHLGVYRSIGAPPPRMVETTQGKLIHPDYEWTKRAQIILDAAPVPWSGESYAWQ